MTVGCHGGMRMVNKFCSLEVFEVSWKFLLFELDWKFLE
jgi:hypothetical protein